jgi:hypothetical protein
MKKEKEEKKENEKEDSELEEEIEEEEEEVESKKFQEFVENPINISIEDNSPSLEEINAPQRMPIRLEEGLSEMPISKVSNEKNPFQYDISSSSEQEPKYQNSEHQTIAVRNLSIEELGKKEFTPQVGFISEQQSFDSGVIEKYDPVKSQDIESLGKENLFETKEIKYDTKKYKTT